MDSTVETYELTFAGNMKRMREARGLTQRQLEDSLRRIGVPWAQSVIAKVERGNRCVTVGEAYQLAQFFDVTVEGMCTTGMEERESQISRIRTELRQMEDAERLAHERATELAASLKRLTDE